MLAHYCDYRFIKAANFEEAKKLLEEGEKIGVMTRHEYGDGTSDIDEVKSQGQFEGFQNPQSSKITVEGVVAYKPKLQTA